MLPWAVSERRRVKGIQRGIPRLLQIEFIQNRNRPIPTKSPRSRILERREYWKYFQYSREREAALWDGLSLAGAGASSVTGKSGNLRV